MLTTIEIETILENELSIRLWPRTRIHGMASAAIAIASHFTLARAASQFVGLSNATQQIYTVPGFDGTVHLVQLGKLMQRCWVKNQGNKPCGEEKPCYHIGAAQLYRACARRA